MTLPGGLQAELDDLRGQFGGVTTEQVSEDVLVIDLQLRGVPIRALIELASYPDRPPSLFALGAWHHASFGRDGRVQGLDCLAQWNRTYGVALVVRELNQRLIERAPTR